MDVYAAIEARPKEPEGSSAHSSYVEGAIFAMYNHLGAELEAETDQVNVLPGEFNFLQNWTERPAAFMQVFVEQRNLRIAADARSPWVADTVVRVRGPTRQLEITWDPQKRCFLGGEHLEYPACHTHWSRGLTDEHANIRRECEVVLLLAVMAMVIQRELCVFDLATESERKMLRVVRGHGGTGWRPDWKTLCEPLRKYYL